MGETIANLDITPSRVSGRLSTWHRVMEEAGLLYDDLQRPIDDPELRRRLVRAWQAGVPDVALQLPAVTVTLFPTIQIDYRPFQKDPNRAFNDLVQVGRYDWVNSDVNFEHFPVRGSGVVTFTPALVHINRMISSEEQLREIARLDLKRPGVEHGLAFSREYPEEQRKYPIPILCEPWRDPRGGRYVPGLWYDASGRLLNLDWFGGAWHEYCRFLALAS